jgi:flagellar motility protein MotE (MotC chaperone)
MSAKLINPVTVTAFSVMASVGLGAALSWRVMEPLLLESAAAAAERQSVAAESGALRQKGWDFWTIEIENLSHELKEERERLKLHAERLEQRAARIAAEEREFAKLRAELEGMRQQIADRIVEIKTDEAKNIRTLAQTYTTLTPKGAAVLLREMDETTAVKILAVMKPDVVGPIFEEMSRDNSADTAMAKRAASLSEKLRLMKSTKPGA